MKTEYQLFICDVSGKHEPICVFVSDSPFPNFQVNDRFDDHGWHRLDGTQIGSEEQPIRYTIHSIKHVITTIDDKNIVQIGLNLKPYGGDRSPAFTEDVRMSWSQALMKFKHKNDL